MYAFYSHGFQYKLVVLENMTTSVDGSKQFFACTMRLLLHRVYTGPVYLTGKTECRFISIADTSTAALSSTCNP